MAILMIIFLILFGYGAAVVLLCLFSIIKAIVKACIKANEKRRG